MSDARTRFHGGTAVVTGAGSGLGEGLATVLGELGMHVIAVDIDVARAEAIALTIRDAGGQATARALDVTDAGAVDALAEEIFATHAGVDLLFNNAGVETAGLSWEISPRRWRQVLDVNVQGVVNGVCAFVPRMLQANRPAVVANTSSVGGVSIAPFQAPYVVSKHAVTALTECLHQELALQEAPIQVSVVLPYYVRTRIFLDAQAAAPSENPLATAFFDYMQRTSEKSALDPKEAAEHIIEGIARGDFWVFSHDEAGAEYMRLRAAQLAALDPPTDFTDRLRALGLPLAPDRAGTTQPGHPSG
jgi:NAD(P)-dependent dehydrogenase (short-subunit alcohol dehydrogenase family)